MNKHEKMLYQPNSVSYLLVMLFVVLHVAHAIFTLVNMEIDYSIGIFVIITIFLILIGFLAAVKVQSYSLTWSYVVIVLAGFQLIRFLFLNPKEIVGPIGFRLDLIMIISIISLVLSGIIGITKSKKRTSISQTIEGVS